jgi:hypothetical protein
MPMLMVEKAFTILTLDFGTASDGEKGSHGTLNKALPAALLTELQTTGRFSIREAGAIRGEGLFAERNADRKADAYLSGKITSESDKEVCFDVWLSNATSHAVFYARSTCVELTAGEADRPGRLALSRPAINRLADDIARSVKQVGSALVTSVTGRYVTVNKGSDADLLVGMPGYLVATGDGAKEDATHRAVMAYTGAKPTGAVPSVVAELYVVSVEKDRSVCRIGRSYAVPGDTVFFK